ncbi:hypothetical protein [Rathayibacter toxicus]|uniref:hypothetical protein n=1 Tax=Rathayibacter toxicus TaxID=145458 RepID=UPI00168D7EBB|nr:hypothetical protein [Rathayibacter toxicus]QOD10924.1 hypothetical protein BSG36_02885 [Rathayibacter toxicus]
MIEERKEKYAQVLEKCYQFLVTMKNPVATERFASYARMVREANSLREVRKICAKVRGHFGVRTGGIEEQYVVHADGSIDIEASDAYDAALQEVRKYSCPLRWLI